MKHIFIRIFYSELIVTFCTNLNYHCLTVKQMTYMYVGMDFTFVAVVYLLLKVLKICTTYRMEGSSGYSRIFSLLTYFSESFIFLMHKKNIFLYYIYILCILQMAFHYINKLTSCFGELL